MESGFIYTEQQSESWSAFWCNLQGGWVHLVPGENTPLGQLLQPNLFVSQRLEYMFHKSQGIIDGYII